MIGFEGNWAYSAVRGDPVKALRTYGNRYDALMVIVGIDGNRAGAGLMGFFGGSVSRSLIRYLDRPVLVVPLNS